MHSKWLLLTSREFTAKKKYPYTCLYIQPCVLQCGCGTSPWPQGGATPPSERITHFTNVSLSSCMFHVSYPNCGNNVRDHDELLQWRRPHKYIYTFFFHKCFSLLTTYHASLCMGSCKHGRPCGGVQGKHRRRCNINVWKSCVDLAVLCIRLMSTMGVSSPVIF